MGFVFAFILSQQLQGSQQTYWAWAFLCAIVADFLILELVVLTFSVLTIMIVGVFARELWCLPELLPFRGTVVG